LIEIISSSVARRQRAEGRRQKVRKKVYKKAEGRGQKAEGKEEGLQEGQKNLYSQLDLRPSLDNDIFALISSLVEYLHYGGNKAEGRGQRAEGKKEGCKVKENYK